MKMRTWKVKLRRWYMDTFDDFITHVRANSKDEARDKVIRMDPKDLLPFKTIGRVEIRSVRRCWFNNFLGK